jgi:hypothetical protein
VLQTDPLADVDCIEVRLTSRLVSLGRWFNRRSCVPRQAGGQPSRLVSLGRQADGSTVAAVSLGRQAVHPSRLVSLGS